jgi:hypothetical protein
MPPQPCDLATLLTRIEFACEGAQYFLQTHPMSDPRFTAACLIMSHVDSLMSTAHFLAEEADCQIVMKG